MSNDPWVFQESKKCQHVELPVNQSYAVIFKAVEDYVIKDKTTGVEKTVWKWSWEVKSGEFKGVISDTLTDRIINPDTFVGKLISGLIGRELKKDDHFKSLIEACIGKTYIGVCQAGPKGGKPCIRTISKPPEM